MSDSNSNEVHAQLVEMIEGLRTLMSDSDSNELYAQVLEMVEGDGAWIRRVRQTDFLRGLDLLALIFFRLRDKNDPTRDEKIIIEHWEPVVMRAVKEKKIVARNPHSYVGLAPENVSGWGWALSISAADWLFAQWGKTCSEVVDQVIEFYEAKQRRANPDDEEQRLANPEKYKKEEQSYKRKYHSALLEILAMAMARYGHDPKAETNSSISQIERDFKKVTGKSGRGKGGSNQTIRDRLREASKIHDIYEFKEKS